MYVCSLAESVDGCLESIAGHPGVHVGEVFLPLFTGGHCDCRLWHDTPGGAAIRQFCAALRPRGFRLRGLRIGFQRPGHEARQMRGEALLELLGGHSRQRSSLFGTGVRASRQQQRAQERDAESFTGSTVPPESVSGHEWYALRAHSPGRTGTPPAPGVGTSRTPDPGPVRGAGPGVRRRHRLGGLNHLGRRQGDLIPQSDGGAGREPVVSVAWSTMPGSIRDWQHGQLAWRPSSMPSPAAGRPDTPHGSASPSAPQPQPQPLNTCVSPALA